MKTYPCQRLTRRAWLASAAGAGAAIVLPGCGHTVSATNAPAGRVAIARCERYDNQQVLATMAAMFDQLGGVGTLVKGKTVAMKVNLTGPATQRFGYYPSELSHYTHPAVIGAAVHLLGKAGAKRIRILEGCFSSGDPLEEFMMEAGWDVSLLSGAAPLVEFENTNLLWTAKKYARVLTPNGGLVFKGFDLNPSYQDCDVFVSIAKMKEHATAGITLSMKNCFGITPITIYGDGAGEQEPSETARGGRSMLHTGYRQPAKSAPGENPGSSRDQGARVPRIVADLVAARPIHLAIIDGITAQTDSEGPWNGLRGTVVNPGLLVAGMNPVNTDAVGMALMGFDPMADRGRAPFERSENTLRLAEEYDIGTRDLRRIEVVGAPIQGNVFDFRKRKLG